MKIAIYSRKSKFTEKGDSIENQVELARKYIMLHYPNASEGSLMIFEDEGFSGKNLDRPQFKAMMARQAESPFDAIVVYRLDRISRNVGDFATLIDKLTKAGTAFVSISEQFDTSTSMGRAMMNVSATFAQLERETIAERIRDNMFQLARNSHWTGGTTPLGYRSEKEVISDNGKVRSFFKLVVNEEEAAIVQLIFQRYLQNHSCKDIEVTLINKGIRTRKGIYFNDTAVRRILTNPVYCEATEASLEYFRNMGCEVVCSDNFGETPVGFMPYNRTDQRRRLKSIDKWLLSVGTHEPIILAENWIEAQRILNANSTEYNKHARKLRQENNPISLLNGVLYCSCGAPMRTKRYRTGDDSFSYICTAKERSRKKLCNNKNCVGKQADSAVKEFIINETVDENVIVQHLKKLEKTSDKIISYEHNLAEVLARSIAEKQNQIDNLTVSLSSNCLNGPALSHINMALNKALAELEELKSKQTENNDKVLSKNNIVSDISYALSYLSKDFDKISIIKRRELVRKIIRKAVWDGEKLDIYLVGSDDEDDNIIVDNFYGSKNQETSEDITPAEKDDYAAFREIVPDVIRQYAAAHNISLRKLSAECGVSYTALKKWLNKVCCPSRNVYTHTFREYFLNKYDKK